MGRSNVDDFMPDYPDIIPVHPERAEWTDEDYEKAIAEEMEKVKGMTEWPDI